MDNLKKKRWDVFLFGNHIADEINYIKIIYSTGRRYDFKKKKPNPSKISWIL